MTSTAGSGRPRVASGAQRGPFSLCFSAWDAARLAGGGETPSWLRVVFFIHFLLSCEEREKRDSLSDTGQGNGQLAAPASSPLLPAPITQQGVQPLNLELWQLGGEGGRSTGNLLELAPACEVLQPTRVPGTL